MWSTFLLTPNGYLNILIVASLSCRPKKILQIKTTLDLLPWSFIYTFFYLQTMYTCFGLHIHVAVHFLNQLLCLPPLLISTSWWSASTTILVNNMLKAFVEELSNWEDCKYPALQLVILSIAVSFLIPKLWRNFSKVNGKIPGNLGLPLVGESFSFLSATNSTKGCYDFVRIRRLK